MKTANIISLTAKETAALVRKALKEDFPETKFSVTSKLYGSNYIVTVAYRDGADPQEKGIREYLEGFQSKNYDMLEDYHELTGFEYKGQQYSGADYVEYSKY